MRDASLAAVLVIAFLVSLAVFMPSVLACPCDTPAGEKKGCSSCHEPPQAQDVSFIQLEGPDLHKAVAEALADDQVKTLRKVLIQEGYTPRTDKAEAFKISAQLESGQPMVVHVTILPFQGDADFVAILNIKHEEGTGSSALVVRGENVTIYYLDAEGQVQQLTGTDWGCVASCIIMDCLSPYPVLPPYVCEVCLGLAYGCVVGLWWSCIALAACVGVLAGYCILMCP